jgi:hypothetical protein
MFKYILKKLGYCLLYGIVVNFVIRLFVTDEKAFYEEIGLFTPIVYFLTGILFLEMLLTWAAQYEFKQLKKQIEELTQEAT